jgi:dienelactone hydrolase
MHMLPSLALPLIALLASEGQPPAGSALRLESPSSLLVGDSLLVTVGGGKRGERASLRAERDVRVDSGRVRGLAAGRWRMRFDTTVTLDARGARRVYLPLWAVRPSGLSSGADTIVQSGVRVTARIGETEQQQLTRLRGRSEGVQVTHIREDGLDGAFGAPAGPGPHPLLIVLHGSEGGDSLQAARQAARFASRGFATFALNYVVYAYGRQPLPGVPSAFLNVPVEMVDRARTRIAREPGVDTARTGILGVSKGAEFALVIASLRSWPQAVVACVPSDVVWGGFGTAAPTGVRFSSWSDGGAPLAYIPYDRYEQVFEGKVTAREVHDRSLLLHRDSVGPARIPVERIRARTLLIGATDDDVWPSGAMADRIAARMRNAGRSVELMSVARGGHAVCGDGVTPAMFNPGAELPTTRPPDPIASAQGSAESWRRTLVFLHRSLH